MIHIVAFLIENFSDIAACPQGQDLGEMLENAGFADEEIGKALMVLEQLDEQGDIDTAAFDSTAMRVYHDDECEVLPAEVRSLLYFLEKQQALKPAEREFVIHALMHLPFDEITLENAKVLALLVLWAQRTELPTLIGDDLMSVLHGKGTMH